MRSRLSGFDASRLSIRFVAPIDSTMRPEKSDAPRRMGRDPDRALQIIDATTGKLNRRPHHGFLV